MKYGERIAICAAPLKKFRRAYKFAVVALLATCAMALSACTDITTTAVNADADNADRQKNYISIITPTKDTTLTVVEGESVTLKATIKLTEASGDWNYRWWCDGDVAGSSKSFWDTSDYSGTVDASHTIKNVTMDMNGQKWGLQAQGTFAGIVYSPTSYTYTLNVVSASSGANASGNLPSKVNSHTHNWVENTKTVPVWEDVDVMGWKCTCPTPQVFSSESDAIMHCEDYHSLDPAPVTEYVLQGESCSEGIANSADAYNCECGAWVLKTTCNCNEAFYSFEEWRSHVIANHWRDVAYSYTVIGTEQVQTGSKTVGTGTYYCTGCSATK